MTTEVTVDPAIAARARRRRGDAGRGAPRKGGLRQIMIRVDNVIEAKGALILGAGVAGLFTALKLAPFPALVIAGAQPGTSGSSAWAQGGIAAALDEGDSPERHAADTIAAGAGLCDPKMAALLAREAPARIEDLLCFGAPFDRDAAGNLALGREAAHSHARIVHVQGDRAGAAITATLAASARAQRRPSLCWKAFMRSNSP